MAKINTHRQTTFAPEAEYHAQPYNLDAHGFFFTDYEDYTQKQEACHDGFGNGVEEFELTYIGNDGLTHALFEALSISQATIKTFIEVCATWEKHEKLQVIIAVGEVGQDFDIDKDNPHDLDIDIYHDMTMVELAENFVDEGLFGDIPSCISNYIDYEKIARDLGYDYTETIIAGECIIYPMF